MPGSPTPTTYPVIYRPAYNGLGHASEVDRNADKVTYRFTSQVWINTAGLIPLLTLPGHEGPR